DPTQFATLQGVQMPHFLRNFFVATLIGDIRSVNGDTTAKGTYVGRVRVVKASPTAAPGSGDAIADVTRISMREHIFEILDANGTEIGTLMSTGFAGGNAPPGTGLLPDPDAGGNWAIVGGTGAYLGARGEVETRYPGGGGPRGASMT